MKKNVMKKFLFGFCLFTTNLLAQSTNPVFWGFSDTNIPDLLRMEVQGNNAADETVIYFDPTATDGFSTANDGVKILATSPGIPSIFTIADNQNLAINSMANLAQDRSVPLGVFIQTGGQYNLVATDFSSFAPSAMIYLEDAVAGTMQNLRVNNTYSVQLAPGTYNNRFFLHISPPIKLIPILDPCVTNGKIKAKIQSLSTSVSIQLIDENNTQIQATSINPDSVIFSSLNSGNYKAIMNIDGFIVGDYVTIPENNIVQIDLNTTSYISLVNEPVIFYS